MLEFVPVDGMDEVIEVAIPEFGEVSGLGGLSAASGGLVSRAPATPHGLPDGLAATGKVARPRGRRTPLVVSQPTTNPGAL